MKKQVAIPISELRKQVRLVDGDDKHRLDWWNDYLDEHENAPTSTFREIDGTLCCKRCGVGGIEDVDRYCYHCGNSLKEDVTAVKHAPEGYTYIIE